MPFINDFLKIYIIPPDIFYKTICITGITELTKSNICNSNALAF